MSTDNGKITIGFIGFMLVIIKAILYERTVAMILINGHPALLANRPNVPTKLCMLNRFSLLCA